MNSLINEVNSLLSGKGFDYSFCGGYAIDLFLGYESREHLDVDISAYSTQRNKIIIYMQSIDFEVYEMLGEGRAHHITDVNWQQYKKRNIFCIKDDCELVQLDATEENDIYCIDFKHICQTKPNFIEFLFDETNEANIIYARNKNIKRNLSKAIIFNDNIPFLCPELCLLYKSTDINREGYQQDYDLAIKKMNEEQVNWLNNSLRIMFPEGHVWISK